MRTRFRLSRACVHWTNHVPGIALLLSALLLSVPSYADAPASQPIILTVVVESSPPEATSLDVVDVKTMKAIHLLVKDSATQSRVKALALQKGDHATITTVTDQDGHDVLLLASVPIAASPLVTRLYALGGGIAIYLALCLILTLGKPLSLLLGEDGRYSNSKFQIALWFGILIATYLATILLRVTDSHGGFWGNVGIPNNLLLLSGMSALTFGAAKGITTAKVEAATNAGNPAPKPFTNNPRLMFDLMHNDKNGLDIGDFQMIVVTLVAVVMYLVLVVHFLGSLEMRASIGLPDVDSTILAAFGLGHGAYLTKKAVGNVGET